MFSDVNPLMASLKSRPGQEQDLNSNVWVERIFTDKHHYPTDWRASLPLLRTSLMRVVMRAERLSLLKMFSIHTVDVSCSIVAALLAVQVLNYFDPAKSLSSVSAQERVAYSVFLAISVFVLNVFAASLHAQKIERETLVVFRVQTTLARWLNSFVLNMSRDAKAKFPTGDIVNLAQTDARHIAEFFAHAAVDFPVLFVSVSLIVAVMWQIVGPPALVALLILILQIPVSMFFSWLGQRLHGELMRRSDARLTLVTEWVQAARLVRYFGWTQQFVKDIRSAAKKEFLQDLKLKGHYSSSFGLSTSWWMLVALGVFAGFLWFHEKKSASQVFAAIWLSSILGQQLNPLPWFVRILSEARVGARRMENIFQAKVQSEEFAARGFLIPPEHVHSLEEIFDARNISFELRDVWVEWQESSQPALRGVSVTIPAGALTAIVGPVGAGKSVLLQTLMGEMTPSRGEVLLHAEIQNSDSSWQKIVWPVHSAQTLEFLRRYQTFVPQEAFVAAASVRENIPLRYLNASEKTENLDTQVVNALARAQLSSDIGSFPAGLSTELGERGVNLSGGQKQRLSLARAVFARRPLVFLDDPLSAVDTETEDKLVEALLKDEWKPPTTVLWATHRLAHLALAEKIVVLDQGCVVEVGSWLELSRAGSRLHQILSSLRGSSLGAGQEL